MRYHGNYCGPNWSAGKHQGSVVDHSVPAVDDFDYTCLIHDSEYATNGNLAKADLEFFEQNVFQDTKRTVAALAVGTQGLIRSLVGAHINMTKKQNLRGSKKPANNNAPRSNTTVTTVPASYGFTLKMTQPKVTRSGNKATIIGADFAGTVRAVNTSNYQPAASVFLNPAYFQNAMLGSLARAYEKFRFVKAILQYIPSVPTSTQGQLVICSSRTVKEPLLDGASTSFLSRALSQGNAVATPLWKEATLEVACSGEWSVVDALLDVDLDDCIQEEIQCYTTCDSTVTCGILMIHYEVEFRDPLYTFHPTMIPVPMGNGSFGTLTDNSAANAIGDSIRLSNSSLTFSGGSGSVYRLIFRQEASTLGTGPASWADLGDVATQATVTTSATTVNVVQIGFQTGSVFYGLLTSTDLVLYASYEGAVGGQISDGVYYNVATTTASTYAFISVLVRLAPSLRITNQ